MGDILVFLTGQDDIDAAVRLLTEEAQNNRKSSSGLVVLPLYSGLSRADQDLVFSPIPRGKRKVVISTNIAETSLTLEGVSYVVDSGFSKQRFYNPISNIENLVVAPISKASARQGLVELEEYDLESATGTSTLLSCARNLWGSSGSLALLYSEEYFVKEMSAEGIPEMQRSNLVSCVIQGCSGALEGYLLNMEGILDIRVGRRDKVMCWHYKWCCDERLFPPFMLLMDGDSRVGLSMERNLLKALGIDNILGFDWPASPSPEAMIRALEVLYSLGVLDDDAKLTSPAGFQVAEIPLDPMVSKMILASNQLGCSEEIITIAAILSIQSIWISVRGQQKDLDEAKLRFAAAEGDHVTFLNVYKGFLRSGKSPKWCNKNFVNYQAMRKVVEIREQLKRIAQRIGIVLKSCESDMQVVRKAVTAGFFANACNLEVTALILLRLLVNPKWVIYNSLVSTDRQYMRNVISIDPSWLIRLLRIITSTTTPILFLIDRFFLTDGGCPTFSEKQRAKKYFVFQSAMKEGYV
ncbi:hypothetical protein C3L33_16239, partial [Rhododendron williamsianum]